MHPGDCEGPWGWLPSKWLKAGCQRLGYWSQSVTILTMKHWEPQYYTHGIGKRSDGEQRISLLRLPEQTTTHCMA